MVHPSRFAFRSSCYSHSAYRLVNGYLSLVNQIGRTKNRLKAVFRSEAINTDSPDFYTSKERVKELSHESAKFVAESLFWQIASLEKQKGEFREAFRRNIKRYKPIKNLTTIPGIDLVRANIIAAIVCFPERFKTKHKFWGYCMLARHIQESDGKIYGNKRIHGRAELKGVYLGAAESALRTDSSLRNYYDLLRAKGTPHREAKISLARKNAAISLSLLKNNDTFKDAYDDQQRSRTDLRKKLKEAV